MDLYVSTDLQNVFIEVSAYNSLVNMCDYGRYKSKLHKLARIFHTHSVTVTNNQYQWNFCVRVTFSPVHTDVNDSLI